MRRFVGMVGGAAALLAGCGGGADLPLAATTGPNPRLPPPEDNLLPTVEIAAAVGWPEGARPTPAEGLRVAAFAEDLDHPRQLYVLPNGDVLVAESAAPADSGASGLKAWAASLIKTAAGANVQSADRITLLRDADGDGTPELRTTFLDGLRSPFGMALVGDDLYVANTDAVLRFPYREGATRIDAPGEVVVELPAGPINQHWTRNLLADPDGGRLYVAIGSASNIAEHGLEREEGRAAIWEADLATGASRVYASGLRNPVGLAWEPEIGALWAAVNERDELGDNLPPDYITAVREGAFYGWPFSYWGGHVDERVQPQRPELVARAVRPDYALGTHVAPLGLAFAEEARLGPRFAEGAVVALHGSWNREPPSGYEVVFVPFEAGSPAGPALDLLTGFLHEGEARGRPVGVAFDATGALLVADDVGNAVWRVAAE